MSDQALLDLAQTTAEAVEGILRTHCGDAAVLGAVAAVPEGGNPFGMIRTPALLCDVGYVGGGAGGNFFAIPAEGARALAAAMMGSGEPQAGDALSDLEMSAVGEAMNQMMAAAAAAMSALFGHEVDIEPPRSAVVDSLDGALARTTGGIPVVSASFTVCGHPARLVQVVPRSFLVRMGQVLAERRESNAMDAQPGGGGGQAVSADALRQVRLRVWAEIGRTRLPMSRAVGIRTGEVVELDRAADDPVDLYVNGRRFATGTLLRVDDADWAVRIDALIP